MKIAPGCLVTLHFETFDSEGEKVESSRESEIGPLMAIIGAGELPPGIEAALAGKSAGEHFEVELESDDAYGPHDPESIIAIPRSELPDDVEVVPGDFIPILLEPEEDEEGLEAEEVEVPVIAVEDDAVVVDLNHPLAGQTLRFHVEILAVEPGDALEG